MGSGFGVVRGGRELWVAAEGRSWERAGAGMEGMLWRGHGVTGVSVGWGVGRGAVAGIEKKEGWRMAERMEAAEARLSADSRANASASESGHGKGMGRA